MPCADEVGRLQRAKTPEAKLFQEFCEKGHYAGRTKPTGTRQGIYAVTPTGELLASWNSRRVDYVKEQMSAALAKWEAMSDAERLPEDALESGPRPEDHYPEDGLVLQVFSRDLPREDGESCSDWRKDAWNVDHLWLSAKEARALAEGNPHSFLHVIRPEIDLPEGTDEHADEVYEGGADALRAGRTWAGPRYVDGGCASGNKVRARLSQRREN